MGGKFSRDKGARFERQCVLKFIDEGYIAERRGWAQRFAKGHPDVLIKDGQLDWLWVECKGQEKFLGAKLRKALLQAIDDCEQAGAPFEVPCVVSKENHCSYYIHLPLDSFFKVLRGDL